MKELKQQELKVFSSVDLDKMLVDVRPGSQGQRFGTVRNICQQYGITCKEGNGIKEFIAPSLRLQMLIEKLHFSRTPYSK